MGITGLLALTTFQGWGMTLQSSAGMRSIRMDLSKRGQFGMNLPKGQYVIYKKIKTRKRLGRNKGPKLVPHYESQQERKRKEKNQRYP